MKKYFAAVLLCCLAGVSQVFAGVEAPMGQGNSAEWVPVSWGTVCRARCTGDCTYYEWVPAQREGSNLDYQCKIYKGGFHGATNLTKEEGKDGFGAFMKFCERGNVTQKSNGQPLCNTDWKIQSGGNNRADNSLPSTVKMDEFRDKALWNGYRVIYKRP